MFLVTNIIKMAVICGTFLKLACSFCLLLGKWVNSSDDIFIFLVQLCHSMDVLVGVRSGN